MRIADKMSFEQVNSNLAKNRSEMSQLQNQAATQKRVTKPSDDPVAAARVLGSRVELSGTKQYIKNLDFARSFLEITDQSLGELTDQLIRAKELALSQAGDAGSNELSRDVVATEIEQIYNQIVQIGNRQHGDRFIFSGFKTTTSPFDINGFYSGDSGEMMIHVDKGSFLAMNIPGAKVFLGEGLSKDGITHGTTQQARTIEEFVEQGQSQEIKSEPKKTDSESALYQREPSSGRGGTYQSDKQKEPVKSISGVNLFAVVSGLTTALRANDKGAVQDALEYLDAATSQVVMARSQVGSRVMTLNSAMETLQKSKVDSNAFISQMEDADTFEVVSDINKAESTLKATLATSGKLIQPSLLDFLR
ncbi:MAG: flagellar hook-associated protein FlgL [Bdellovibrionales bacterium]|nr:flagellar hook-associated protein FlgL [Bdellovibrionales bacterium]